MLKHIPNALTLTRLILAPVIALLYLQGIAAAFGDYATARREVAAYLTTASVFFVIAAITDLFDGIAARAFNAHSKLGRLIDPIADKALVGLPLIAIALIASPRGDLAAATIACATAVIVIRDVTMTVVRLSSPDGEGTRVSSLAKWKTALELVVVGSLLVVSAISAQMMAQDPPISIYADYTKMFETVWIALLVVTAALSAYTAWQYLRPAKKT